MQRVERPKGGAALRRVASLEVYPPYLERWYSGQRELKQNYAAAMLAAAQDGTGGGSQVRGVGWCVLWPADERAHPSMAWGLRHRLSPADRSVAAPVLRSQGDAAEVEQQRLARLTAAMSRLA